MSRLIVALVGVVALGVGLFVSLREPVEAGVVPGPVVLTTPATPRGPASRPGAVFVSPARPGLIITVKRNATAEPGVRLELFRAELDLTTNAQAWRAAGAERTDDAGRATFPAVAGHYLVLAVATDGTRGTKTLDVSRAATSTSVELELRAPVRVEGRVVDATTRRPLAEALVQATPPDALTPSVVNARADALGRFALELPGAEAWRIEARAAGHVSHAELVELPGAPLELALEQGVTVDALVVTEAQAPVSGVTLHLAPGDVTSGITDEAGHFTFTAPRGPVSLHASAGDGRQGLARVVSGPGVERITARVVLAAGTSLLGTVRAASGPVEGAEVRVLAEPDPLEIALLQTDAEGRFEAKGLPRGRYSLRAQQGPGRRASAVGLELPGEGPVELTLSNAGRLTGVVLDEERHPLADARVTLGWPSGMNEVDRTAVTGEDGRFEFDELLSAELVVQARLGNLASAQQGAYLAPGAALELTLTTSLQGRLVGLIEGREVDTVMIRGERDGEVAKVRDGHFEQLLAPGKYKLYVRDGESIVEQAVAEVRGGELTEVTITVPPEDGGGAAYRRLMHRELGSGLSFENAPGGVRVDFLMQGCPASAAGVRIGDLVVSIDGQPTRDALDAFSRVRKSADGTLELTLRREGKDFGVTVK